MKKLIFALFILCASVTLISISTETVYASGGKGGSGGGGGTSNKIPASQVPAPVKKNFKADFPTATQVEWEYTPVYYGTPVYTANFKLNGTKWAASYYADGTRISAYPNP